MQSTFRSRNLPDADRLSVLAAMILLAYALARFVNLPAREFSVQLPGIYLSIVINIRTAVTLLVAALTAAGAEWLIHDHPAIKHQKTVEHWLLPALTAWVIGLPLFQLPLGLLWWGGFVMGGVILMLVLVAEYIVVDPDDVRQPPAAAGLTVLSFTLYLALVVALRLAGIRLYLLLPGLSLAAGLVGLRVLHLRLHGRWAFPQAGIIAFVTGQLIAALYYWPFTAISFGLALLAPAYALTNLLGNLANQEPFHQAFREPLVVLVILWGLAIWIR